MGLRRACTALMVGVAVAACGGGSDDTESVDTTAAPPAESTTAPETTAPPTTISPEEAAAAELEADRALILQMWRDASDSWGSGDEAGMTAGFQFLVDNSYPGTTSGTAASCRANYEGGIPLISYQEEIVVHADTIARDDGWIVPGGAGEGIAPGGRIYIHQITFTPYIDGQVGEQQLAEVHTTVEDGRAFMFIDC